MRQIGSLPSAELGQRFGDYLLTRGIEARVDQDGETWAVWIFDEDQLELGRKELSEFQANPDASHYTDSASVARKLRHEEDKAKRKLEKKRVRLREEIERPVLSKCPITMTLMAASIVVGLVTDFGQGNWELYLKLMYSPRVVVEGLGPFQSLTEIRSGEVWRVFTPMFLHFKRGGLPFHLIFNMMWLYSLGMVVETVRGKVRFLILVLAISALSNTAECLASGPSFGGMSGVVYGLIGYIWVKSKYDTGLGLYMPPNTMLWAMLFFFLCMTGALGPIANWAHGAGLVSGGVIAYVPISLRRLRRRLQG